MTRDAGRTTLDADDRVRLGQNEAECAPALVVIWWQGEPGRVGETLLPDPEPRCFGRAAGEPGEPSVGLIRQRPGCNEPARPVSDPFLSRRHLRLARGTRGIAVECLGKRPLLHQGREVLAAEVQPGDVVEIRGLCSFLCVERPALIASGPTLHDFGGADRTGFVGESPAAWSLRRRIDFAARRSAHVLVTGATGTGKELVARAVHELSSRRDRPLVARNAATLPASLIDAELFGHSANYPSAGMPERPGLIGRAHQSSLFLDEIGELDSQLQAHLLRVLDAGEYQRLGEARNRAADLRLVAATNRDPASLKHDLRARLALHVHVPGLDERPEDVPLLARHLVRGIAQRDPELGARFVATRDGVRGEPRISAELACGLASHEYTAHVRELEALLWRSMESSPGDVLECTQEVRASLLPRHSTRAAAVVSPEELRAAMIRHDGVKERVWRDLGLSSRHALVRLMKKLGET